MENKDNDFEVRIKNSEDKIKLIAERDSLKSRIHDLENEIRFLRSVVTNLSNQKKFKS